MHVTTIGLDIAKRDFQVHGVDSAGNVVVAKSLTRDRVIAFFAKLAPCRVGIEACASGHYWAREIVEDQEVVLVELGERTFERQVAAGLLQLLNEIGGAGEEDPVSVLDESKTDGRGKMALAGAGRAEQKQVGSLFEPAVAGDDGHDLGLGDHRHGVELEGVEGLSRQEAGFDEVALDAAAVAFSQLMLGKRRQEASGRPGFLVGLIGELRPDDLAGGNPI